MQKACTSRAYAKTYRFSAAEYLPITDSTAYRASKTATEPDWGSIMIYDSKMGSALTKPNGDAITQVLSPSQRDVDGLKRLYGVSPSSKFNPLGSKSNPKKNAFNDIRKKERDSGCGEVPDDDPTGVVECGPASCGGGACSLKKRSKAVPGHGTVRRAVPTTSDPTWGFLNKPTTGGLDAFTKEFFDPELPIKEPFLVDLTDPSGEYVSTSIFLEFKDGAFFSGVMGLFGCTSVLVTSQCGMFMVRLSILQRWAVTDLCSHIIGRSGGRRVRPINSSKKWSLTRWSKVMRTTHHSWVSLRLHRRIASRKTRMSRYALIYYLGSMNLIRL